MAWRLQSFGFLLIIMTLLACISATSKEEECLYELEVETSCYPYSGTDGQVHVRFGDKSFYDKNKTEVLERHLSQSMNEGNAKPFRKCKTDKFTLSGPCLKNKPCYAYFKVDDKDNWRVNHAIIRYGDDGDKFVLDKKLPENAWCGVDYCNLNSAMSQLASVPQQQSAHKHVSGNKGKKRRSPR